jgi:hypothetical protein
MIQDDGHSEVIHSARNRLLVHVKRFQFVNECLGDLSPIERLLRPRRVLPIDGFGDRFRINEVVLVWPHERLFELSWNQLHIMALFSQGTAKEVSTRTCLHPDQASLQVGGKPDQLLVGELLTQQYLPCCAQRYNVKGGLAKIDTNRTNLHIDDLRPESQKSCEYAN